MKSTMKHLKNVRADVPKGVINTMQTVSAQSAKLVTTSCSETTAEPEIEINHQVHSAVSNNVQ